MLTFDSESFNSMCSCNCRRDGTNDIAKTLDVIVQVPATYVGQSMGGIGGGIFDDQHVVKDITAARIMEIRVRWYCVVDAIQLIYYNEYTNQTVKTSRHGGKGGSESVFYLAPGECIVKIEGRSSSFINRIQFFTNLGEHGRFSVFISFEINQLGPGRASPMYGGDGGSPFTWHADPALPLSGFGWFSGKW